MKKSVIIGSLVAGAFLLPAIVNAGVVSGRCDKCHTMHASQDGSTTAPNNVLLKGGGCAACHAETGLNNANGVGGTFCAPQVNSSANPLSGGYFTAGAVDTQHNVATIANADTVFGAGPVNRPGGTTQLLPITCEDCHTGSGSHHGTAGPYRMISGVTGSGDPEYGVATKRSGNTYYAAGLNAFCGNCHGDFHGNGAQSANLGTYGGWIRHPVNIHLADADIATSRGYASDYAFGATVDALNESPLGRDTAATEDILMCLSCHVAHGNSYNDMLAWSYNGVVAGGNVMNGGCENCHSYNDQGY